MTSVLVLHSVNLVRSALTALLRAETSFDVSAAGWRTARRHAETLRPDVCVVDVDCPEAAAALAAGQDGPGRHMPGRPALLVLATASSPGPLRKAYEAKARGYVDKDGSPGRLARAIQRVADGERFLDASLASALMESDRMPLSPRELTVLARAAEGDSIAEIARSLHLASGTVRNYLASATRKTGARNRVDAIRISLRSGWV
ncbi:response regulator transcription factor [Streptomyces sp. NPDC097619]|uniref:response regulator transcription factor n=1 Tax=Streptomyces sp. NPDC097619 TaxID=3157228 RepID=UPI0033252F44